MVEESKRKAVRPMSFGEKQEPYRLNTSCPKIRIEVPYE
jgi:hypothetical protein